MNEDLLWEAVLGRAVRDAIGQDMGTVNGANRPAVRLGALDFLRSTSPLLAARCQRAIPPGVEDALRSSLPYRRRRSA